MVTVAGTTALAKLLDKWISTPPVGAEPLRKTVPETLVPPVTDEGLNVISVKAMGFTFNVAL